jgi:lipoprotein-anchoring transpeptidase ErfK/SrfK
MKRIEWQARIRWAAVVIAAAVARAWSQELPAQPEPRIVVSIPDRKLAVLEAGRAVRFFDVAVGAPVSPSPTGTFTIVNRIPRPTYYAPGIVIEPGKRNPLGTRWLGLSLKGFGIHGTNLPRSIGKAASHGCVRLRNRDAEELFELVRAGDVVELHGERNERVVAIFGGPSQPAAVAVVASAAAAAGGGE